MIQRVADYFVENKPQGSGNVFDQEDLTTRAASVKLFHVGFVDQSTSNIMAT